MFAWGLVTAAHSLVRDKPGYLAGMILSDYLAFVIVLTLRNALLLPYST